MRRSPCADPGGGLVTALAPEAVPASCSSDELDPTTQRLKVAGVVPPGSRMSCPEASVQRTAGIDATSERTIGWNPVAGNVLNRRSAQSLQLDPGGGASPRNRTRTL